MEILDIRLLGPAKKVFHWDEPADSVGLEGEPAFQHPVSIDVRVCLVGERVIVEGTLRSRVSLECSRCLEGFERPLEAEVALDYREGTEPEKDGETVRDDEVGVSRFTPPYIDMGEDLRQILLLEVPAYPVCRDDCRGLCPSCGANRNEGACGCGKTEGRGAFQELGEVLKKGRKR